MLRFPPYDYFEERAFGSDAGDRRRGVRPILTATGEFLRLHRFSAYPWIRGQELESGRPDLHADGIWPINFWRAERAIGDPGTDACTFPPEPDQWPGDIEAIARTMRGHHYFRVHNAAECIQLLPQTTEVRLAVEITSDWFDPPDGVIPRSVDPATAVGTHGVPITSYDAARRHFIFVNSWGAKWGDHGTGYLPVEVFDSCIVEAWVRPSVGLCPPVSAGSGLVELLWKWSDPGLPGVHGREIVDASNGDRIAWAFAVPRGVFLDIEELYVWPSHRGKGYGTALCEMLRRLAKESRKQLRAWVSFADCGIANRPQLDAILAGLGLERHSSNVRWAGFVGLPGRPVYAVAEPRIPARPAVPRFALSPWQYPVWYATDRNVVGAIADASSFGTDRGGEVHYGRCVVTVPRSHRFGSIGSSWFDRLVRGSDDRLKVDSVVSMPEDVFWSEIRGTILQRPADERHSLIYIHGFRVSFEAAAIRAAQIGFDLKVPGVTAFFSWPSKANILQYSADEATIEASETWRRERISRFQGFLFAGFVPGGEPGGFVGGRFGRWSQDSIGTSSRLRRL